MSSFEKSLVVRQLFGNHKVSISPKEAIKYHVDFKSVGVVIFSPAFVTK